MKERIAVLDAESVENFTALVPLLVEQVKELSESLKRNQTAAKLYSVADLCELWNMSSTTVRKHLDNHGVKPIRFTDDRSTRYRATDIHKLLQKL